MLDPIGKDSSSSQLSSWGDSHEGPHFTLTTFPDGKMILTTPSYLTEDEFNAISALFNQWVASPDPYPLVIGNCKVAFAATAPREGRVIRG